MTKTLKYLSISVLFALSWTSCTQERLPCLTPKKATMSIQAKQTDGSYTPVDTALPAALFIAVSGVDPTSGVYFPNRSAFTRSLSPNADSCVWAMATDTAAGSVFDTMVFHYERQLQFLSNACSYVYFYYLDSVVTTHNNIDSIKIITRSVNNDASTEHLQIFFHP